MRMPFIAGKNEPVPTCNAQILSADERRAVDRWWWRFTLNCWKAVGVQAKEWRCSRLYVITIAVADMLKVDAPKPQQPRPKPTLVEK